MAEPIYKIDFTVKRANPPEPPTVTPTDVQPAGYYGDDKVALVTFALSEVVDGHRYRIEIVDGNGAYDITELLDAVDRVVSYTIPAAWTAAGTATLQLVEIEIGEDGTETAVMYYPPARSLFEARDNGPSGVDMQARWQELMSAAELASAQAREAAQRVVAAQHIIENGEGIAKGASALAAAALQQAGDACEKAAEAFERSKAIGSVWVGSGPMPEGYNLQIDPNGEALTMDEELNAESQNPVSNRAITAAINGLVTCGDDEPTADTPGTLYVQFI